MYKNLDFLRTVFQYNYMLFLGSFNRSFRKSRRKKFLTPCHVTKVEFSSKILENRLLNYLLIFAQPKKQLHMIFQLLLRLWVQKNRVASGCVKSYGVLKFQKLRFFEKIAL